MDRTAIHARYFDLPAGVRLFAQMLAVILCATAGSFVVGKLRFGSALNLGWMVLLPELLDILLNKGMTNRLTSPVFWVTLSVGGCAARKQRRTWP